MSEVACDLFGQPMAETTGRIYHHYEKWEEYHRGMWKLIPLSEEPAMLKVAIGFTGDAEKYGTAMFRAVNEWPISCEQNLTNPSMNHRAWIGHAACCIAIGAPEYLVRRAWSFLTEEQQTAANKKADEAIAEWHRRRAAHA